MTKKRKKSAKDLISELPDEVIHCILRLIESPKQAAKTIALSKRWRSVWRSYPVVAFHYADCRRRRGQSTADAAVVMRDLESFCNSTIDRFCRDSRFRIEALKISLIGDEDCVVPLRSRVLELLLILASTRKAEEIHIEFVAMGNLELPFRTLSDCAAKILRLTGIVFAYSEYCDFPLSLGSLRSLHLNDIEFKNGGQLFMDMIACAPLLETLEFTDLGRLGKLRVSNVANLKTLEAYSSQVEEVEITAPKLETLILRNLGVVAKADINAPRLKDFELVESLLTVDELQAIVSKLPSLKSLTLGQLVRLSESKKLKFLIPKLEKFELGITSEMEEIELDAGPDLVKFVLNSRGLCPDKLTKCKINNPSPACRWEADFSMLDYGHETIQQFAGFLKSFISRFNQLFHTLGISVFHFSNITFSKDEVDYATDWTAINHLQLYTDMYSEDDQRALLDGLFWAFHPKFFTVYHWTSNSKQFFTALFNLMSQCAMKTLTENNNCWLYQLKDVKIVTRNVDAIVEQEKEADEEDLVDVSEDMATLLATQKQVCLMLTWQ
ncbi:F-box protein At5g03100 [Linum grandiflorum]